MTTNITFEDYYFNNQRDKLCLGRKGRMLTEEFDKIYYITKNARMIILQFLLLKNKYY